MEQDKCNHKFTLYIEPELKEKIKVESDKQKRSMTAEIKFILEQFFEKQD